MQKIWRKNDNIRDNQKKVHNNLKNKVHNNLKKRVDNL